MTDFENIYAAENLAIDTQAGAPPVEEKPVDTPPVEKQIETPLPAESPKETPKTEDKPVGEFDSIKVSSKLSEVLGEQISELNDDVFEKLNTKIKSSSDNEKALQAKIDELQKIADAKPNYKNSALARIDKLQSLTNIEDISVLSKLASKDVKNMSAFDAMKTAFILENPDVDNEEDINDYLLDKFNVSSEEELNELVGSDRIKLKQEEREAKKKLDGIFSELNKSEDESKEKSELEQKRLGMFKTAWTNVTETAKQQIKEINIPVLENGKEKVYMGYALKDADAYFQEMTDFLSTGGRELTEDNLKEGLSYLENRYFLDHKAEIITSIIEKERSSVIEEYEKKYANVVPLGAPVEKGSGSENQGNAYEQYLKGL